MVRPTTIAVYGQINVRLEESMFFDLKTQAERDRTTVSELVRTYISWGLYEEKAEK